MNDHRQAIAVRIDEDDGLVAGLSPDVADAVRQWCYDRADELSRRDGPEAALAQADDIVAVGRLFAEILCHLDDEPGPWMAARVDRIVGDGDQALRILNEPRPLADRVRDVLSQIPLPV